MTKKKKKRLSWRLPRAFKGNPEIAGFRKRQDGEPRFVDLVKHRNDRTLSAQEFIQCCDCGLTHLHTYNVMQVRRKWYIIVRAFRQPVTYVDSGKKKGEKKK